MRDIRECRATAIAETEAAKPIETSTPVPTETFTLVPTATLVPTETPTHTPTEIPLQNVELVIMSSLAVSLDIDIWTIEYGMNGSISSETYTMSDLDCLKGYRVYWSKTWEAKNGDTVMHSITGIKGTDCIILVDEEEVIMSVLETKSSLFGNPDPGKAICQYQSHSRI